MADTITIYFAAPLFTQAEWQWNARLREELQKRGIAVILPQDRSAPMLAGREPFDPQVLFAANIAGIQRADLVLAVLDQPDPDSGTAWECGYACGLGKPVIGLRTDLRVVGDDPDASLNLMLSRSCAEILRVPPHQRDDPARVAEQAAAAIRRILAQPSA